MIFREKCQARLSASIGVFLLAFFAPVTVQASDGAATPSEMASRYGARASILDLSLSPSGQKIAWIAPGPDHSEYLYVIDLGGDAKPVAITANSEIGADLTQCEWATEDRLVCRVVGVGKRGDGLLLGYSRAFAIGDDGSDFTMLTQRQSSSALGFNQFGGSIIALDAKDNHILITRNYIPERTTGTRMNSSKEGLGVDRIDVTTGKRSRAEPPDERASDFIADDKGEIRIRVREEEANGLLTGEKIYLYRAKGSRKWKRLEQVRVGDKVFGDFNAVAVDSARDQAIAYVTIDGHRALIGIRLDGTGEAQLLARRKGVDVDGLLTVGRQRRIVGVTFATEKRTLEYFDDELAGLASALGKALPNQPLIDIVGASADENHLLIVASSDTDPGMSYLFNKATQGLEALLPLRAQLQDQSMGKMRAVSFPAADGTQIPAYLTLPPGSDGKGLPAVVLPHGGPAARDFWGFDWLVQFFVAKGYAVLQPNYRGSSGYGEAWFGRNGYQAWDVAIGDVNDAGRWLIGEGIAKPEAMVIAGWSYGGYAALQSQVVDPELYNAVIAIAPVTDLEFLREDARAYTNFRLRDEQLGRGPHIAAGSPRRHAEGFRAPVALFHGTYDLNVAVRHSRSMAKALERADIPVTYREFEDLEHSLRGSKVRAMMLSDIERFLDEALAD